MKNIEKITFERLKPRFALLGFTEATHYEHGDSYGFVRNLGDVQHLIELGRYKKKNSFTFGSGFSYIFMSHLVSNILQQFVRISKDNEPVLLAYPGYDKNIDSPIFRQLGEIQATTEEGFEAAWALLSPYIESYVLPFFDKAPSLQAINDEVIEKVFQRESKKHMLDLCAFISGETQLKALIIMKLCGNPRYVAFAEALVGVYDNAISIDPVKYKFDYDAFHGLRAYLDSGKYQEVL